MVTERDVTASLSDGPPIRTGWSSLRRALASLLSAFSLPLLFLAAISVTKLLYAVDLLAPTGWLKVAVEWQIYIVDLVRELLAFLRLAVPAYVFDIAVFYIFVGNAVARAERDELLAVEMDEGTAWETFKNGLRRRRADYFFYGFPASLRGVALRLLWPVAAVYRLGTPWVVEGPGPDGEDISTSVRRREIGNFFRMVAQAGKWERQVVYDHRLVLLFQIGIGVAAALVLHGLARLM